MTNRFRKGVLFGEANNVGKKSARLLKGNLTLTTLGAKLRSTGFQISGRHRTEILSYLVVVKIL